MTRYYVEFVLSSASSIADTLSHALVECGENLEVIPLPQSSSSREHNFKIQINTADPTLVFDMCADYGKIKSVKVEEGA